MDDLHHEIDELLATANWPAVTQAQVSRLASLYRREQRRLSLTRWGTLAAAAMLMIGVGIWTHRLTRPYPTQPFMRQVSSLTPPPAMIASRDANLLERAMILSAAPKRPTPSHGVAPAPVRTPLDRAIWAIAAGGDAATIARRLKPDQINYGTLLKQPPRYAIPLYLELVQNPATSDDALAVAQDFSRPAIDELFNHLDDAHVSTRMAAARVLGKIDGPIITRQLASLVRRDHNRREALVALISSNGVQAEQFIEQAKRDSILAPTIQSLEAELKNPS